MAAFPTITAVVLTCPFSCGVPYLFLLDFIVVDDDDDAIAVSVGVSLGSVSPVAAILSTA